jgi:CHAT domain-containing protein/tetratricopeptide (TPR) repeat protein
MSIAAARPADIGTNDEAKILLAKLIRLRGRKNRREFLVRYHLWLSPHLIIQLADKARELLRIDARESLALSESAIDIAQILGDELAMAHAIRMKANAKYALGFHWPAVELYRDAIQRFRRCGEKAELGRTLSVSILSLTLCGEYDAAFEAGEQARAVFNGLGDELRLARLEINLGTVYYRQDRFAEALDCYKRAYRVVLDRQDVEGIGVVLSNMAVCLISVGDFPEALQTHQEAREVCQKHGMPRLVAQADYNIAYLYYLRGEYSRAIDMLRSTRAACEDTGDRYHHALCNLDLSELYLELNLSSEASDLARQANAEFADLGMGYERAKTLAFEAIALSQQNQTTQSLKTFAQSREIFVSEKNLVWPSLIDLYQALVLFNEGRLREAARLARAAMIFFDSSLLPAKATLCRLLLARIAQSEGDLRTAEAECLGALDKVKNLQTPLLQHQAFLLMGKVHAASGSSSDAYSCFRASRHALETLRNNVRGQELKLAFLKNRLEVYEMLVDACLERPSEASLNEAFGYIEEAKSRILIDQMLRPATEVGQSSQSGHARSIRDLRGELSWYHSLIELEQLKSENRSPQRLRRLEGRVRRREKDLIGRLQEIGGDALNSGVAEFENVALDNVRQSIAPDTQIIEYFQSGDRLLACLLSRDRLEIVPVTLVSRLSEALRLLKFHISKFRLGSEYTTAFRDPLIHSARSHLKYLYDELLAPIKHCLKKSHLLIIPHGSLHYVPFHALFDGERYLIDQHTVSYSPSASIYWVCRKQRVNTSGCTLLMGIPDLKAPLIEKEILSLGSILPDAKTYLGAAATDDVLRKEGPASRIVHIATHGEFRQDNPLFSSIRLGSSYLSVYDLYELRLPAELVTLSGCATGLNAVAAGDELIGLARGLFQAGAQSLLLSLWDAHDASTANFMCRFYGHLQQGTDRAGAVRHAMLEVREECPHPYHWASFVLMGNHGPLAGGSKSV